MSPRRTLPEPRGGARTVAVIGAGYVGLPTSATLSHIGHRVICAEHDPHRFDLLSRGRLPIVEEGLDDLVREGLDRGTLRFVPRAEDAVPGAEFTFLCVETPQGDDGSADLSRVEDVSKQIGPLLDPGAVVVNKSTVPVGSAHFVAQVIGRADVTVVSNPEFLREGNAVHDSLRPDRLVVGADDHSAAARVGELFAATGAPLIITDLTTSETIKYASNAFLATKLTFVNAVAGLCEAVGADVRDVILGLGYDKRIGFEYLKPGPGWGGSCLPKDTRALVHMADGAGYDFAMLKGTIATNEEQLERVVAKVVAAARPATGPTEATDLGGCTVAAWGLTFKANTDDRRNSPAVEVAQRLARLGARVQAYDPTVGSDTDLSRSDLEGLVVCGDPVAAAHGAMVLVVLTEWDQFRWLDFDRVGEVMAVPSVVDARNLLDPAALRRKGFTYTGIGRT
jgi:UDPglucose 6-dehydrogenase